MIVQNTVLDAGSRPVPLSLVYIGLVSGPAGGALLSEVQASLGVATSVRTELDGSYTVNLTPNKGAGGITQPSGTYYTITEPEGATWTIQLDGDNPPLDPDAGWWVGDSQILVSNPASPAAVVTGVIAVVPGSNVSVDSTDPQRPVVSAAGGSGGVPLQFPVTAVSSFFQAHNLGYPPAVRLIDSTGEAVDVAVEYPDATHVSITFPTPFTGTIFLT